MLYKIGFLISGIVLFGSCGSNTPAEKQTIAIGFARSPLNLAD